VTAGVLEVALLGAAILFLLALGGLSQQTTARRGNTFGMAGTASGYARWQYGGLSSIYTDVNPGNFVRMAFAVDLPDDTGRVLLSTDIGQWIDLGNFSAMQSEDR